MREPAYELIKPLTEVLLGSADHSIAAFGHNHRRPSLLQNREELEMLMATNSPGILIVDDNEDNRYTLQLMLETDGHERIASAAGGPPLDFSRQALRD